MSGVVWRAQPKQAEFLKRREYEVLYGGAAGGGKSDAAIMLPLYWIGIPHFKALILRKTYPQLQELIDKSLNYYRRAFPRAKYNGSLHRWTFPSGATVTFGNMHTAKDRENYRGKQYDLIIFDELTHFTWDEYSFMFSRNRPSGPGTFVGIRATTNPGGIGHGWVKERFITAAPPMTRIEEKVDVRLPSGETETRTRDRIFIPAGVYDNQELLKNDPDYIANLAMMPEADRMAQLYGSWDSFTGQVFTEFVDDPEHYKDREHTHVIEPFKIPAHWRIYRGFDFGFTRPFAVEWIAFDEERRAYIIAEYYGCTGTPNEGVKMHPQEIAAEIKRIEAEHPLLKDKNIVGIADPAIFEESHGESIAQMMAVPNGIYFGKGDHKRIPGKMQYHYRFAFDDDGIPMLYVFNTCKHFIRTIKNLVYDEKHVEDIDTAGEDHIYDCVRYVLMENPISPKLREEKKKPQFDPLDIFGEDKQKYRFYGI